MEDIFSIWNKTNGFFEDHYGKSNSHGNGKSLGAFLYNSSASSPVASDPLLKYFDTGSPGGQFDAQRFDNQNATQIRVRDAIKAGVNPLAALNVSGAHYSPTISLSDGGRNYNSGFSELFKTLGSIFPTREQKQNRAIELESAKLDLEAKRLQNDILRGKLLAETQPGIPVYGQRNSIQDLFVPFRTPDGKIVYRLNQDAVPDTDITNISTWQSVGDDPGSISKWLREVILPTKGSWQDRYLPGYSWLNKLMNGFLY